MPSGICPYHLGFVFFQIKEYQYNTDLMKELLSLYYFNYQNNYCQNVSCSHPTGKPIAFTFTVGYFVNNPSSS